MSTLLPFSARTEPQGNCTATTWPPGVRYATIPVGFECIPSRKFEICSQWIEFLPTDQVVPVEVTYDPKTGHQV